MMSIRPRPLFVRFPRAILSLSLPSFFLSPPRTVTPRFDKNDATEWNCTEIHKRNRQRRVRFIGSIISGSELEFSLL